MLHLSSLKLINFKNYEAADLEFSPKVNCFGGQNGLGKTNILDAIHYLCLCRSRFQAGDKDLVMHGQFAFRLDGKFVREDEAMTITCKFSAKTKKAFLRNNVPYTRFSEHIGLLPLVMITPDDTEIATGYSPERRSFMDATLSQTDPQYLNHLVRYTRILEQRNALLKSRLEEEFTTEDMGLLESYNHQMIPSADYISRLRQTFCEEFKPYFTSAYNWIAENREDMAVVYQSKLVEEDYPTLLVESFSKDRALGRTTQGIHKDDIVFVMNGHPLKKFASQGQMKSFIISLRLAQYAFLKDKKGIPPILLLDDIFDKLDPGRVTRLISLLMENTYGQVFITDTQPDRLARILSATGGDYKMYEITGPGEYKAM